MANQVTVHSWNEAVERQFPWISEQFKINRLTSRIKISKVSTELLEVVPSEEYGTDLSGYYTYDQVKFHDSDGKVLGEVSPRMRHSDANDMSSDQEGETIGDRWYHLEYPTSVAYLTRKTYYSGGCLSHDPDSSNLEIFKVSDFDVRWWMFQRDKANDSALISINAQEPIDVRVDRLFDLWGELEDAVYDRVAHELVTILTGTDARTFWECAQAPTDIVVFDGSDTPLRQVPDAYLVLRRINHKKRQAIINRVSEILNLECPAGLCDLQGRLVSPPEWAL